MPENINASVIQAEADTIPADTQALMLTALLNLVASVGEIGTLKKKGFYTTELLTAQTPQELFDLLGLTGRETREEVRTAIGLE